MDRCSTSLRRPPPRTLSLRHWGLSLLRDEILVLLRGRWYRDLLNIFKFSGMQMKGFGVWGFFSFFLEMLGAMLILHLNIRAFSVLGCCYGNIRGGNSFRRGHGLNLR